MSRAVIHCCFSPYIGLCTRESKFGLENNRFVIDSGIAELVRAKQGL